MLRGWAGLQDGLQVGSTTRVTDFPSSYGQKLDTREWESWGMGCSREQAFQIDNLYFSDRSGRTVFCKSEKSAVGYLKEPKGSISSLTFLFWCLSHLLCRWFWITKHHELSKYFTTQGKSDS